MIRRRRRVAVLAALALLFHGCSPEFAFAPVRGTVTLGGKPVPGVVVYFYPDARPGPRAWGVTDSEGRYRVQTDSGERGAVPGAHRVCITRAPAEGLPGSVAISRGPNAGVPIPENYCRPNETPLRAEVQPGGSELDFQLP